MLYLLLHILGNAVFLLLVRVARSPQRDYYLAGLTNYATAAVLALLLLGTTGPGGPGAWSPPAVVFGVVNGVQYVTTYLLMFALIGMSGIAVTTGFMRLSVAVPVIASIAIWGEWPGPVQAVGLLLAAAALPLLSSRPRSGAVAAASERRISAPAVAALVGVTILVSGCGLLAAKAFAELEQPEQRPVYSAAVYVAATVLALAYWPWRRRLHLPGGAGTAGGGRWWSVALGVVIGVVNLGQILLLLPALAEIPGVIAFPLSSAGGLAAAALGAWLFWREPLGGRTGAGIALAMAAAALVNAG